MLPDNVDRIDKKVCSDETIVAYRFHTNMAFFYFVTKKKKKKVF